MWFALMRFTGWIEYLPNMSVTGSLMNYENSDDLCNKKNRSLLNVSATSKQCTSLNSSINNSMITTDSIAAKWVKSNFQFDREWNSPILCDNSVTAFLSDLRSFNIIYLKTLTQVLIMIWFLRQFIKNSQELHDARYHS